MRYLYTNKPDQSCHEINGVYGRPVHKSEEKKLFAEGWVINSTELKNVRKEPKEKASEKASEEAKEKELNNTQIQALELGIDIYDDDGREIHHRKLGNLIKERLDD
jgi:hypothetical protein